MLLAMEGFRLSRGSALKVMVAKGADVRERVYGRKWE